MDGRDLDGGHRYNADMSELRILSVGAHPADIFDQSGGTMAHHVERGDWVGCVVLTHGARVHDKVISDAMFHAERVPEADELRATMGERADVKAAETVSACRILGVENVIFFGADDAVLLVTPDLVRRLASEFRKLKPDVVLTHFPKEGNGVTNPHAIAGQVVLHALSLAAGVDPGDTNPPHRAARVFYFGTGAAAVRSGLWDASGGYTNDVFIDISDVVEKKLAALDCLQSQGYAGAYARKRIETSDGAFGSGGKCSYAEGFIAGGAETYRYLPVSEHALRVARSSDHENIEVVSHRIQV